jgi:hypothetical protein
MDGPIRCSSLMQKYIKHLKQKQLYNAVIICIQCGTNFSNSSKNEQLDLNGTPN